MTQPSPIHPWDKLQNELHILLRTGKKLKNVFEKSGPKPFLNEKSDQQMHAARATQDQH